MSSNPISISIKNLSKAYHIYSQPHHRLLQMLTRGRKKYFQEFWALKNISFEVQKGETVGIVGRNGSGKSTLLQIICGTLNQTSGQADINGRIAALLELGAGFNPEFSGRENVYLYSAILGLSREETDKQFSKIIEFADIGEFLDRPVKTYSSGMVVRLAFAVAINVEPDILIVDEALAVGDELFQRKCYSKIEQLKKNGVTILFVSHSASTVVGLCDRAILLDGGELLTQGNPKTVVGLYQRLLFANQESRSTIRKEIRAGITAEPLRSDKAKITQSEDLEFLDPALIPKSTINYEARGAVIKDISLRNDKKENANCLLRGRRYTYSYDVDFTESAANVSFGMLIKSKTGIELGGQTTALRPQDSIPFVEAGSKVAVSFEFECNLNPGTYYLNAGVKGETNGEIIYLHRILDGFVFRVLQIELDRSTGLVDFKGTPSISIATAAKVASNL